MGYHLILIQYRYTVLKNEIVKGSAAVCRVVLCLVNMILFLTTQKMETASSSEEPVKVTNEHGVIYRRLYSCFPSFFIQFFSEDGAVASLLHLLSIYLEKDLQILGTVESYSELNSDAGSSGSVEDVIVKVPYQQNISHCKGTVSAKHKS